MCDKFLIEMITSSIIFFNIVSIVILFQDLFSIIDFIEMIYREIDPGKQPVNEGMTLGFGSLSEVTAPPWMKKPLPRFPILQ